MYHVEAIYKEKVSDTPQIVYKTFDVIRKRLKNLQAQKGDFVSPLDLQLGTQASRLHIKT